MIAPVPVHCFSITFLNRVCCFQSLDAVFQKPPNFRLIRYHNICLAAVKRFPVHRLSVGIFTFSGPLGLKGPHPFKNIVALNPGLDDVKDYASAIIPH